MCGIAGIITQKPSITRCAQLELMNKVQHHRGPDGEGIWTGEKKQVHFAHVRLAIIDLSNDAAQPMVSKDKRYSLIFNGEIYNYKELRKECQSRGSYFFSNSDTEVIIECFRHWGEAAFAKFVGMWALAIYDEINQCVYLSRDPFAIKPLYYGYHQGDFYFSSEPKALRAVRDEFNEIDEVSVRLFIEQGSLERKDWTFYKNIKRFPHGHFAKVQLKNTSKALEFSKYWQPSATVQRLSYSSAVEKLKFLLEDSIRLHLRSDVPVGSCLSGGIDSSSIVCIGSQHLKPSRFNTFTTHYPNHGDINESQWAEMVNQHVNAIPHYIEPTFDSFCNDFERLITIQDEPFGSTSIFAQYTVFKKIAETNVKVVLDGQGADEAFAGYVGFIEIYLDSLLKQGNHFNYLKEAFMLRKNYALNLPTKSILTNFAKNITQRKATKNPTAEILTSQQADEYLTRLEALAVNYDNFDGYLQNMLCESNIPQLLRYEDRNSMAFSIESRVPFLEPRLIEFALSLPGNFKIRNGLTKSVLRDAIKSFVPRKIANRVDKLGFPTPEIEWMNKAFNCQVDTACSKEWREIVTKHWRSLVEGSHGGCSLSQAIRKKHDVDLC